MSGDGRAKLAYYVTKRIHDERFDCPDEEIPRLLQAYAGRRFYSTFGTWKPKATKKEPRDV